MSSYSSTKWVKISGVVYNTCDDETRELVELIVPIDKIAIFKFDNDDFDEYQYVVDIDGISAKSDSDNILLISKTTYVTLEDLLDPEVIRG